MWKSLLELLYSVREVLNNPIITCSNDLPRHTLRAYLKLKEIQYRHFNNKSLSSRAQVERWLLNTCLGWVRHNSDDRNIKESCTETVTWEQLLTAQNECIEWRALTETSSSLCTSLLSAAQDTSDHPLSYPLSAQWCCVGLPMPISSTYWVKAGYPPGTSHQSITHTIQSDSHTLGQLRVSNDHVFGWVR